MGHVSVLGSGAWGTALAMAAHSSGNKVDLWSPFEKEVTEIKKEYRNKMLPGIHIPEQINVTNDIKCAEDSDLIVIAVPSFAVENTAKLIQNTLSSKKRIIANAAKGFCPNTGKRFSEVIKNCIPNSIPVALSGPSHAEEVSRKMPTSIVSASADLEAARIVQDIMTTEYLRIYVNSDVVGVELGGALKNIIALCSGICDGMGFGDNTKAALITRGLSEIARLGVALGAKAETFAGLSGLGDLIVTCDSMHSRNRRAGILIGKGIPAKEAVDEVGTVEGYYAVQSAFKTAAANNVDTPIINSCHRICFDSLPPEDALRELMRRPKKNEAEDKTWLGSM